MKKKGFTLIELLAVIVILAIIALIAVPVVLNIIEKARSGAAKSSAYSYIKAIETYAVTSELDNKNKLEKNTRYNVTTSTTIDDKTYESLNNLVEIKGSKPTGSDDYILLDEKKNVKDGKLTIDNYVVTIKNGDIESVNKGDTIEQPEPQVLADVASIGDYVAYDAGTWTETKEKPTSQGNFGGYTEGQNKANSVATCYTGTTTLKGWRVYSIDTSTKTVTLIHAGQPECYYHATDYASQSITNLNNRATSEYLNNNYASSAHMMNKSEADQNILRTTGDYYWLAAANYTNYLWYVYSDGNINLYKDGSFGVRPVVVLKSNILTNGKGKDMVGQTAWTLVKP